MGYLGTPLFINFREKDMAKKNDKAVNTPTPNAPQTLEEALLVIDTLNNTIQSKDQAIEELMSEVEGLSATKKTSKPLVKDSQGNQYLVLCNIARKGGVKITADDLISDPTIVDELVKKGSGALKAIEVSK